MMGTPLFSYKVSQGIHSVLNSSVRYWLLFLLEAKETVVKTFSWSPRRKIGDLRKNLCCSVTGTLHEDTTVRALQKSATTGCLETTQRNL